MIYSAAAPTLPHSIKFSVSDTWGPVEDTRLTTNTLAFREIKSCTTWQNAILTRNWKKRGALSKWWHGREKRCGVYIQWRLLGLCSAAAWRITNLGPRGRGPESDSHTGRALCVTWGSQSVSLNLHDVLNCKVEVQPPFTGLPQSWDNACQPIISRVWSAGQWDSKMEFVSHLKHHL